MATKTKGGEKEQRTNPARWLKAAWHPLQVRALTILTERVASPKEIAADVGEPVVSTVAYHVRELEKRGLIELVRTEQRRGATEHFYKAVVRPMLDTGKWPKAKREKASALAMQLFLQDVAGAMEAGTFDEYRERHLSRAPLTLDRQGFLDLAAAQDDLLERALEIQAESDQRRAESQEPGQRVTGFMATFTMPPVETV